MVIKVYAIFMHVMLGEFMEDVEGEKNTRKGGLNCVKTFFVFS